MCLSRAVPGNIMYYGKDETGKRYSRLSVITFDDNAIKSSNYWLCVCDCGNVASVLGHSMRSGHTRSCGCLGDEKRRERAGVMGQATAATRLPKGIGARRALLRRYKQAANKRDLKFQLSDEEAIQLFQSNCFYCGASPSNLWHTAGNGDYSYSGIDRMDSNKDYSVENCVSCCSVCNYAKMKMSAEDFIAWIFRASEYLKENTHARN